MSLITTSRFGDERAFILVSETRIQIKCSGVTYYNYTTRDDQTTSIDPDGGPYIHKNMILEIAGYKYRIVKILDYKHEKSGTLEINVQVELLES